MRKDTVILALDDIYNGRVNVDVKKEEEWGVFLPPTHINCRCAIEPWEE